MTETLKLLARDGDDLRVMSAVLQDAIVPVRDMGYQPEERRFVLIANRFRWETADRPRAAMPGPSADAPDGEAPYERINCAVRFDRVEQVSCRGLDPRDRSQLLELLVVERTDGAVILHFAGDACLRLSMPELDCRLEDLGEPWPSGVMPTHDLSGATEGTTVAGR